MVKYSQTDFNQRQASLILSSLSDPTRREILKILKQVHIDGRDVRVSDLAQPFEMSLPAISKHLKILEKANLIKRKKEGREYKFTLTKISRFWIKQLDNLEKFLKDK